MFASDWMLMPILAKDGVVSKTVVFIRFENPESSVHENGMCLTQFLNSLAPVAACLGTD